MGDKITQLPAATSLAGNEIAVVVQGGTTKQVSTAISRVPLGTAGGDLAGSYPNPTLAAITTAQASVGSTSLIPVITTDAKGRVTGLSTAANPQGTVTNVTAGTGLSGGPITSTGSLSVVYGTTAGTAAQGNDTRFSTIPSAGSTLPLANGSASAGTSASFSRADHVHPQGTVTLSGDVTGSGTGSITATLANITSSQSNVGGANNFPTISIDAKGRVTSLSSTFVPPTAITTLTGDVTASGPGIAAASLSASGVAAGTYGYAATGMIPSITVDAKGRVTSASQEQFTSTTDRSSTSAHTLQYGSKTFTFLSTGVVPYSIGQWVTIRPIAANQWISGVVAGCLTNSVSVNVFQSSAPSSSTQYTDWSIKLGQTINYFGSSPTVGQVLSYDALGRWVAATPSTDAQSLRGYQVSTTAPTAGQSLIYNGTSWTPTTGASGNATSIVGLPIIGSYTNGSILKYDQGTGSLVWSADDAVSLQGYGIATTAPSDGESLVWDQTAGKWTPSVAAGNGNATQIQSRNVSATAPTNGQVLAWDNSSSSWVPTSGGGGGDATSIQGTSVSATPPTTGQSLVYNGSQWLADAVNASELQSVSVSSTVPSAGQVLLYNGTDWAPSAPPSNATSIQGQNVSATSPSGAQALVYNGTDWAPADVNAVKLQGQSVSATTPTSGQALVHNGTDWTPTELPAIGSNWNSSQPYNYGDLVVRNGSVFQCITYNSGIDPFASGSDSYWAKVLGGNASGGPNNTSTPAGWTKVTIGGYGPAYIPFYA